LTERAGSDAQGQHGFITGQGCVLEKPNDSDESAKEQEPAGRDLKSRKRSLNFCGV
jgi:hypothetical protein